ncbi:MAG: PepSY domain-containing protein [Acutalibacteraceae bacterium]
MTKTTKKALSLVLTLIMTLTLCIGAFAAITLDEAKSIALSDAGFSATEVRFAEATEDKKDKEFDIEFYVDGAEYDYTVNYDGKIVSFSYDSNKLISAGKNIDEATAKQAALDHFGKTKDEVKRFRIEYDREDNDYEIEFVIDGVEYDVAVSAFDGEVVEYGYENVTTQNGIMAKLMAFIDAILAFFRNLFNR